MARLLGLVSLSLVLALAPTGLARAQTSDESMDVEAHALFEAGRTAFAAGRFATALTHFQGAYDLSHRGALLYNIGQCHDRLRHDQEALTAFRGYLEAVPDAPQRAEVESRIAILEEALSHAAPPPDTTTTTATTTSTATSTDTGATTTETTTTTTAPIEPSPPPPPPAPPPASSDVGPGPWIVLGAGAAFAIAGIVMVGVAQGDISSVQNAPMGSSYASVRDAYEQAPVLSGIGFAAIGVGAAAIVAGIVWGAIGSSSSSGASATLRLTPTGLTLQGTF